MAASGAVGGFGTLLKVGDGGGTEVFTTLAEVTNISGPSLSTDTIEVTHMESPNSAREYIAGLKDGGEVSFDLNFIADDTTQAAFITDWSNRTKRNFKIVWTDDSATTWSFTGIVTAFEPSASVDDKVSASATIKLTGIPTFS